ncbi:hypothetical protein SFC55_05920 [Niallia taxi]|uniref:hypothetical protein n=1 Tax=Niallia TaxID=2837506 RepID=UPI00203D5B11|nr:hypothetical protein [Niallia sp. MER 6]MCM3031782.1 hypothetical protein [Niallia sp. MER 6]
MDARIQALVDYTKEKLSLGNYYLYSCDLDRKVTNQNKTVYSLEMEWLPEHIKAYDEEDEVPEGTASVSISIDTKRFNSIIFVGGKSYLDKPVLQVKNKKEIIRWIERESGLTYEEDFISWQEDEDKLSFIRIIDGLEIRPKEWMEIEFDEAGQLVFYSVYGSFIDKLVIRNEPYTLNLHKAEHLVKKQFQQWDFSAMEQQRIVPAYAIEEVYIRNDLTGTLPFDLSENTQKVNFVLEWAEPIYKRFKRKPVKLLEELTPEQAFACEPHPETFPISDNVVQICVKEVKCFLQKMHPNDSGKWRMTEIHRRYNYIGVKLVQNQQSRNILNRKLLIMLDGSSFKAFNYMDNEMMLDSFPEYKKPREIKISQEEAYEAIKDYLILKPYYVYDKEKEEYVLCGFLDCHHYVDGETGKVGLLNDL